VKTLFIEPSSLWENGYNESFNGSLREECLNAYWFASLSEAKGIIEAWRREYNESWPHKALGQRTSMEFAWEFARNSEPEEVAMAGNSP